MTFNIYTVEAKPEVEEYMYEVASDYELVTKGLGVEFLLQVEAFYFTLKRNPYSYSYHRNSPPLREGEIKQFPFLIVFTIIDLIVVVHKIFDTRRDPLKKTP